MNDPKKNNRPLLSPKTIFQKFSVLIATFFGSGLLPKAPGTWGTLASLPLFWWIAQFDFENVVFYKLSLLIFILVIGTLSSMSVLKMSQCTDHQSIVIDEVLGVGITLLFCQQNWIWFLIGTLLFRAFDIIKLPPVHWIDKWSKEKGNNLFIGGFGVMADDLVAGLQGLFVLEMLRYYFR